MSITIKFSFKEIIKKIWFPIFIIAVVLMYIFVNKKYSIILLVTAIALLTIEIIYDSLKTRKFIKYLQKHSRIDDIAVAKKLNKDVYEIKDKMSKIMHEKKIPGKIILFKNTYVYYSKKMIGVLKEILIDRKEELGDALRVLSKHGFNTKSELKYARDELARRNQTIRKIFSQKIRKLEKKVQIMKFRNRNSIKADKNIAAKHNLTSIQLESKRNFEYYVQYPGACGLVSILMGVKPIERRIDMILDKIWDKISHYEYPSYVDDRTYNWQIALEWILFQIVQNEKLQKYLEEQIGNYFPDFYLPRLEFRIKSLNPSEYWVSLPGEERYSMELTAEHLANVDGEWIMRRVQDWKEDFELIMLFDLFGFSFIHWEGSYDGTGSIFFTDDECDGKSKKTFKKKMQHLNFFVRQAGVLILIEKDHWKVVKEFIVKDDKNDKYNRNWAILQDPISGRDVQRAIESLYDYERFYYFDYSEENLKKGIDLLNSII